MASNRDGPASTTLTVVHAPACHFCDEARDVLRGMAAEFAFDVEFVEASGPRGVDAMAAHRAAMYPLVLVDGEFFSSGRLPRAKLRKLLERRCGRVA